MDSVWDGHPEPGHAGLCCDSGSAGLTGEWGGGEVVVVIPGGEVRRKTFEKFDGDNGLRVVGADLL